MEFKSNVEELIFKLPSLCGARESWGRSGWLQYLDESHNPQFYARIDGEMFEQRAESYAAFRHFCTDPMKANYGLGLLAIVDANHKGFIELSKDLQKEFAPYAGKYQDIDLIITFEQASVQSFWAP